MSRLHHILLSCLFSLQIWEGICQECGKEEYLNDNGNCTSCRKCPRGQEPNGVCGFGTGAGVGCRACAPGTFSSRHDMSPCTMHTQCIKKKRIQLTAGTANADAVCKECLPGYFPLVANSSNTCIPCWLAPPDTVGCEGQRTLRNRSPRTLEAPNNSEQTSPQNSTHKGAPDDSRTEYAVLAIVPVFCMMGLSGILLCNILKKKGYRCTSQKVDEEAAPEKDDKDICSSSKLFGPHTAAYNSPPVSVSSGNIMMEENGNEDTIGVLVRLITEKKENAVALEELLKEYQTKQMSTSGDKSPQNKLHLLPQMPILCKHQHHLHTVQGPASRSNTCCTRCSQKKWPDFISPPQSMVVPNNNNNGKGGRTSAKAALGEITILSVGRFCVARIPEQKPNPVEVKPNSEAGVMDASGRPEDEVSEQKLLLLSNTVRAKKRSLEDTSKLEDVI